MPDASNYAPVPSLWHTPAVHKQRVESPECARGVYRKEMDRTVREAYQSTSSIFDASSSAPSTSSSGGKSSSPASSSSSSMLKPSLIMRWMRPANCVGSSPMKPEVSSEVSKRSQMRSFTVLSDLSAAAFFLNSV